MKRRNETQVDPVWALQEGAAILKSALDPYGFRFKLIDHGTSSGGKFAAGEFRKKQRRVELHFRYSLGLVRYHEGDLSLSHENFLKGLGVWGRHHYPGFTSDPVEPFRQLRDDLREFAGDFLQGKMDQFKQLALRYQPVDPCF